MLLEQVYQGAPTVQSGRHRTTVNEFTDQSPALRPAVLQEAVERLVALGKFDSDKLLVEEDKGAIIGGAVSLAVNLPLAVARWYSYRVGEQAISVPITSEYFSGTLYVNGIEPGDRVTVIDDTISTGGTLIALIEAVQAAGATVSEVLVVVEKPENGGCEEVAGRFGVDVKTVIKIAVDKDTQTAYVLS
jgi:adenine phosphoribosyltransferase